MLLRLTGVDVPVGDELGAGAGDFDAIVGPWIEPGYGLAISMLRDRHEARDAVQEATVKAWRSLHRPRDPGPASVWFLAIVANHCRSTMRRRWWSVLRSSTLESATVSPEESVIQSLDIDRAMGRLSPENRATLYLYYYLDLPMEEVARLLGISVGAARARVYHAAHRLRPDLELMEDDLR